MDVRVITSTEPFMFAIVSLVRVRVRLKRRLLTSFPPGSQAETRSSQTYYPFFFCLIRFQKPAFDVYACGDVLNFLCLYRWVLPPDPAAIARLT